MYKLRCLGGEEPWTTPDEDDAKSSVRSTLIEWGHDDLRHELGYAEGYAHCDKHTSTEGDCEPCWEAEERRFEDVLTTWVDSVIDDAWASLRARGYIEVRKGQEWIWFSMTVIEEAG